MSNLLQAVAIMATGKFLFAIQDVVIKEMSGAYPVHQIMAIAAWRRFRYCCCSSICAQASARCAGIDLPCTWCAAR